MGDTGPGEGHGKAPEEAQLPHSGRKREFCGCIMAVTGWDAWKGWELVLCMLLQILPAAGTLSVLSGSTLSNEKPRPFGMYERRARENGKP